MSVTKAAPGADKDKAPATKPVATPKNTISLEDAILSALPAVMRKRSLEDHNAIADDAIRIGTALYNKVSKK